MIWIMLSAYGGFSRFGLGVNVVSNSKLSDYISSRGYSSLKSTIISYSGGGYGIFKNFVFGGYGFSGFSNKYQNANKYSIDGFSGGAFSFGYIIFSTDKLLIYPTLILGGYSYSLKLYEKTSDSFEDVVKNPKREVNLEASNFLTGINLSATYFFYGAINISLNLGYNHTFESSFNSESVDITSNEKFSFNNFFINLSIGFGAFMK
jgi:hypothetical protein